VVNYTEFLVILFALIQDYGVCSFELYLSVKGRDLLCFICTCCSSM
jgi:hypothetical protein